MRLSISSRFANTQPRGQADISSENDREWSGFSIYLALPLEHCLSTVGASLREAAKIGVCRKTVGTNVFTEEISACPLSVFPHSNMPTTINLIYNCLALLASSLIQNPSIPIIFSIIPKPISISISISTSISKYIPSFQI